MEEVKDKKTILVLGASSFLGVNLVSYLKASYKVIGTYYNNPIKFKDVLTVRLDIFNKKALDKLVFAFRPDIVIYCIGQNSLSACAQYRNRADALNTSGVVNTVSTIEKYGTKFIYFSSPYIFSGDKGGYTERETPMPSTVYGGTQANSEFYIQKNSLNYIIFRVCNMFGRSYNPAKPNFLEFLENKFFYHRPFYCDNSVRNGWFSVLLMAKIVDMALKKDVSNRLFQISSNEVLTQYEFAKIYAKTHKFDHSFISQKRLPFPLDEKKAIVSGVGNSEELNFSMSVQNLLSVFNLTIPTVDAMLHNYFSIHGLNIKAAAAPTQKSEIKYI